MMNDSGCFFGCFFGCVILFVGLPLFIVWALWRDNKLKGEAEREVHKFIKLKEDLNQKYREIRRIESGADKDRLIQEFNSLVDNGSELIKKNRQGRPILMPVQIIYKFEEELYEVASRVDRLSPVLCTSASVSDEIEKLAELRVKGMLSDHEFQAFSERFKMSTGHKAKTIISSISDLYDQHQRGALSEGNYHASLWSLMDKLDRKT